MADDEERPKAVADALREASLDRRGSAARAMLAAIIAPSAACIIGPLVNATMRAMDWEDGATAARLLFTSAVLLLPVALLAVAAMFRARPVWTDATLTLERDGFALRRRRETLRVPFDHIAYAAIRPIFSGSKLHLALRDGDAIDLHLAGSTDGEALIAQASLGPAQRRAEFHLRRRGPVALYYLILGPAVGLALLVALLLGGFELLGSMASDDVALAAVGITTAVMAAAGTRVGRAWFVVGADGVRFSTEWGPSGERFIPFSDVERVRFVGTDLLFTLRGGQTVRAWCDGERGARPSDLLAHIEAARAVYPRNGAGDGDARAALLDRRERSLADWREALRDLVAEANAYRKAGLGRDELLAVLGDVRAPAGRRIGAALALRARGDADAVERVRVVAGASADERVRVALERVAAGSEDEVAIAGAAAAEGERAG